MTVGGEDWINMSIKRIIREEIEDLEWVRGGNKWVALIDSLELLANNRKELPNENPEFNYKYWNRKNFKIWLGETSDEDYKQLRDSINSRGFRGITNDNWVIDSLYITVDRDYSKKSDRVIFSVMGCQKEEDNIPPNQRSYWNKYSEEEKELRLCKKIGDGNPFSTEYKIKPERLKYDREFFERHDAQELFPFD
jgi:hypothetical protein